MTFLIQQKNMTRMTTADDIIFFNLIFFYLYQMSCKVCGAETVAKIILFEGIEEAQVEYCSVDCFNKS
jgi:hypothetical protein